MRSLLTTLKRLLLFLILVVVLLLTAGGVAWYAQDLGLSDPLGSWRVVDRLPGHRVTAGSVALHPEQHAVLALHQEGTARLVDLDTQKPLLTLRDPRGPIRTATLSRDTGKLFTSSYQAGSGLGYARLWDPRGQEHRNLARPPSRAEGIVLSEDGSRVASSREGGGCDLWEASSGEWLGRVEGAAGAFTPDGSRLLTLGREEVLVWSLPSLEAVSRIAPSRVHRSGLEEVQVSRDGAFALTWGRHQRLWVLDLEAGEQLWTRKLWKGEFSPDSKLVLTSERGKLTLWTVRRGREYRSQTGSDIGAATFEPGGASVLFQSYRGIQRWDVATGELSPPLGGVSGRFPVSEPRAELLLTREERTLHLWEGSQGGPRGRLDQGARLSGAGFLGGGKAVYGWTRLGQRREGEDLLRVWKLPGGSPLWERRSQEGFRQVSVAGERWIATLNPARVLDGASGKTRSFLREAYPVEQARFLDGGKQIATRKAAESSEETIWDCATARLLERSVERPSPETALDPGVDGIRVSRREQGGREVLEVEGPGGASGVVRNQARTEFLAASGDGTVLAYLAGGELRIWRWQEGAPEGSLPAQVLPGPARWVAFDPRGESLLVSTEEEILVLRTQRVRLRRLVGFLRGLLGL